MGDSDRHHHTTISIAEAAHDRAEHPVCGMIVDAPVTRHQCEMEDPTFRFFGAAGSRPQAWQTA